MKICKKYLVHVQKSVFEGFLTEKTLKNLKNEIYHIIDVEVDAICIYQFDTTKFAKKYQLGKVESNDYIIG